ncbi:MAG TPA: MBL fold metallo-hydrolase [Solirubrobacteraceae bacterium]|jgi:glyoxylase-like metal-dependent hydrolase (beta-lactamase superfamily II)|nr:MBL fold metallo-hydrolase [Solirubrobacteraceae bacterium]
MEPPILSIDVRQLGQDGVICAFLVGDVLIDCGPASRVPTLLEALGERRPRVLALTHIHLDHAGGAGTLAAMWPDLEIWVHERGAPHLADPTKLLASATRLYGDDMDRLWGEVRAVPEHNLRVLTGGEELDGFEVAYTPGHASHHVSYWHPQTQTAFVGDVGGVRSASGTAVLAPTPPPDIDVELWKQSIDTVRQWRPRALGITHFGVFEDAASHLDAAERSLERGSARAREQSAAEWIAQTRSELDPADPFFQLAAPIDQCYLGLERYWSKREGTR